MKGGRRKLRSIRHPEGRIKKAGKAFQCPCPGAFSDCKCGPSALILLKESFL
jgi:hypothetical protein